MTLGAAAVAQAESKVPPGCEGRNARAYQAGLRGGAYTVRSAWNGVRRDCDRIELFQDIVSNNVSRLTLRRRASEYVICRFTGTVDGVYDELDALWGECDEQCFAEGEFIGEMAAQVYCELSLALGGLETADRFIRGPVQTCGMNFEMGCDFAFIDTTYNYSNMLGECSPYTEGDFEEVWDETRNNQCTYMPVAGSRDPEGEDESL
jgi:hypothetical protein